jgi:ABC-type Zn uptake system ZnuABC Zn-binding protein ZnuA
MKTIATSILCLALLPSAVEAKLDVVATLPDFAAIATEIGGDKIKVTALARGSEDAHFVDAKPSFIRVLNRADVLLEGGADLEIGWLPPLVQGARNAKILRGKPGHVALAQGIRLLEIPTTPLDRSLGDVHTLGNPHYWLDPLNGKIIASRLADVFGQLDPANTAAYRANLQKFNKQLDDKVADWTKRMKPFQGTKVLTYHKSYEYFADRFDLDIEGQIEPKPGIEPSPAHINALIPRAKEAGVKLVIIEPFRSRKTPEYVAKAIGAELLVLPDKVGANEKVKDYFSLFDYAVGQITAALNEAK